MRYLALYDKFILDLALVLHNDLEQTDRGNTEVWIRVQWAELRGTYI
jgi:hypothetical protein